jgi:hypothetical protein
MRLYPIIRTGDYASDGRPIPFGSQVVAYVPEVMYPLQLSHCAPVPLGLLEQLTPFYLLHFDSRPPSCCLRKTITVLMMCGAEVCPLLIIVLNGRLSV